ncbi:MAG: glycoside hydrolase family 65 protein, partial [Acidimicrobiia bacterium]|nr:glycoside hydrolase family 65 protein [Acidimicrobiia bacterium]
VGGLWQALVSGFGGFQWKDGTPRLTPHLPPEWTHLRFAVSIKGSRVRIEVLPDLVTVHLESGEPVELEICGTYHTVTSAPFSVSPV